MRLFRHAGLDPASRRRLDEVGNHLTLGPGFHRSPWIPAFAGMTLFVKTLVYAQTQSKLS